MVLIFMKPIAFLSYNNFLSMLVLRAVVHTRNDSLEKIEAIDFFLNTDFLFCFFQMHEDILYYKSLILSYFYLFNKR